MCSQGLSGVIRCDQVWSGMVRHGIGQVRLGMVTCDQVCSGAVRCDQV